MWVKMEWAKMVWVGGVGKTSAGWITRNVIRHTIARNVTRYTHPGKHPWQTPLANTPGKQKPWQTVANRHPDKQTP